MTGEEFGKILKDAVHLSGKTTVELVAGYGKTIQTVCAMYQNRRDTGMDKIIKFLNVIGFHITIVKRDTKKETEFYDNDEVIEFIRQAMVSENLTYSNLATKFGVSVGRTHQLLNGSVAIRLSLFLKVLELNNYSLRLDAD
jgi:prophage maintenance system killer protein